MDSFRRFFDPLVRRAGMCNAGQYVCFISLEPLQQDDVAFAYHPASKDGSVPIHKKYNTPELRKQWMAHEKQNLMSTIPHLVQLDSTLSELELRDYFEKTFPKR